MPAASVPRPVDALEVTVIVDNVLDILSTVPDSVTSELPNLLQAGAKEMSGPSVCCAAWGLSLLVQATVSGRRYAVLLDGGPEGWAFARNATRLGVDLGGIDAVVLSHGHWDHAGGLPRAVTGIRQANGGRPVPVHVNPGMFGRRAFRLASGAIVPLGEVPGPEELEAAGAEVVSSGSERLIADDTFFLSGEIPRVTEYEKGLPPQVKLEADGTFRPDPLVLDERFLAVHLRGAGMVMFSSCSHAGIVNVLRHVSSRFASIPVHAVFGGLHLSGPANERWIGETVRDLDAFQLRRIVPGHCTGYRALHRLLESFGDRVIPGAVGQRHRLLGS